MHLTGLRAAVSDVFGTLVDWRSGVTREAAPFLRRFAGSDVGGRRTQGGSMNTSSRIDAPAFDGFDVGVARFDIDGRLTYANAHAGRLLGT